jgi:hypothetical protein
VLRQLTEKIRNWFVDQTERAGSRARRATAKADATRLRRNLAAAELGLGRRTADRARRSISEVAYRAGSGELERTIDDITAALAAAETLLHAPPPKAAVNAAQQLLELWPDATGEERNRMLRVLIRSVRVRRPATYRQPFEGRVDVDFTF